MQTRQLHQWPRKAEALTPGKNKTIQPLQLNGSILSIVENSKVRDIAQSGAGERDVCVELIKEKRRLKIETKRNETSEQAD